MLHFYLGGINNQNFLMRDNETGSWWQQVTGKAIYGPLKGATLELVSSDELTFGEWKSEVTGGKVLAPVPKYVKEYDSNWEPGVAKLPVVISFPGTELKSRDVVVGLELDGASRAYPWDTLLKQSPVMDRVHGTPVLVVLGPDKKSFRVFKASIDNHDAEFFQKGEEPSPSTAPASANAGSGSAGVPPAVAEPARSEAEGSRPRAADPVPAASPANSWSLLDSSTASEWNFQGCAISGPSQGKCLEHVTALKDYWFNWRNYHPDTSIYKR